MTTSPARTGATFFRPAAALVSHGTPVTWSAGTGFPPPKGANKPGGRSNAALCEPSITRSPPSPSLTSDKYLLRHKNRVSVPIIQYHIENFSEAVGTPVRLILNTLAVFINMQRGLHLPQKTLKIVDNTHSSSRLDNFPTAHRKSFACSGLLTQTQRNSHSANDR